MRILHRPSQKQALRRFIHGFYLEQEKLEQEKALAEWAQMNDDIFGFSDPNLAAWEAAELDRLFRTQWGSVNEAASQIPVANDQDWEETRDESTFQAEELNNLLQSYIH